MAGSADVFVFKDALIVLGTAAIVAPVMPRLKVSPILGYLTVGALLGPHGLGRLAEHFRLVDWLTVTGDRQIEFIGDARELLAPRNRPNAARTVTPERPKAEKFRPLLVKSRPSSARPDPLDRERLSDAG